MGNEFQGITEGTGQRLIEAMEGRNRDHRDDLNNIYKSINEMRERVSALVEQNKSHAAMLGEMKAINDRLIGHDSQFVLIKSEIADIRGDAERRTKGLNAWAIWAGALFISLLSDAASWIIHGR